MPLTKVQSTIISDQFLTEYLGEVASESAMLQKTGQTGDWVVRTDLQNDVFIIINNGNGSSLTDWKALTNKNFVNTTLDEVEIFSLGGL
tara:strand:- start:1777 stop:2043 length:267 start_codon:yes stop_codon:yes gene_type:complete